LKPKSAVDPESRGEIIKTKALNSRTGTENPRVDEPDRCDVVLDCIFATFQFSACVVIVQLIGARFDCPPTVPS
jgi:hypothetical protein